MGKQEIKLEDIKYHVVDKYYISTDGTMNLILWEKKVVKKSKYEEKVGQDYYSVVGYFGSLDKLYRKLCDYLIIEHLDKILNDNIKLLLEKIDEGEQNLKKFGKTLKK